jgi:hypothetical protein
MQEAFLDEAWIPILRGAGLLIMRADSFGAADRPDELTYS